MRQRKVNSIYVFPIYNQSDWLEISLSHRMNRLFRKHNFDIEMLHSRDGARSANLGRPVKSKFYKKRGATFFYDVTRKLGPLDFTQYRSKSSSF